MGKRLKCSSWKATAYHQQQKHVAGTKMKRPRTALTLEAKLDIIQRLERGQTAASVGRLYNVNESSIRTIKKSAEKIRSAIAQSCSVAAKKSIRVRNPLLEKMEMMLVTWMEDQRKKKDALNSTVIRAKALKLYKHLQQEDGGSSGTESFLASKGWFENFKKRQNLYNTKLINEGSKSVHICSPNSPAEVKAESFLQVEQEEDEEQQTVVPSDELTTKKLALFFTLADRLAQEAMDMDPNLERSLQFGRNLSSALAVYKDLYRLKQHALKHSTVTQYLKTPRSTTLTPANTSSYSLTFAKLPTSHTGSSKPFGTESPLQKCSQLPLLAGGDTECNPNEHSPPFSSCSN
ncbi:hypothetical protein B7P43_G15134 [Cryptotermes secundus]|nr:hypothetical protein B7P43_G15134 [Cryptotermes secundus]